MREAIYRGQSVETGKWVYGSCIPDSTGEDTVFIIDYAYHAGDSYTWEEVIPETVGEFTGIKDKNGKMIFEGDIISSKDSKYDDILHKIVFEDACFRIKSIQIVIEKFADCGRLKQEWVNEFEKEVVGNIHDNPELIKKYENEMPFHLLH